MRFLGLRIMQF